MSSSSQITVGGPAFNKASPPQVGKPNEILISLGKDAGQGPLNVAVRAPLTPKPLEVVDNGNQTMSVKFTPRANGKLVFDLKWGDQPLPGSPFEIEVFGAVWRDASKLKISGMESRALAGKPMILKVATCEEAGPGPLLCNVSGPCRPDIHMRNVGTGMFEVSLTVSKAGPYDVAISWGDDTNPLPGSPFKIEFF